MGSGHHGEHDLAFHICQFPYLLQKQIISGAVVSEAECLADDLALLGNDARLMAPLGNVDPNDVLGVGTCLSC